MNFLQKHGRTARCFYTNVLYVTMLLLGALTLSSLNMEEGVGDAAVPRYTTCGLIGATSKDDKCPSLETGSDEEEQLLLLFNIAVSTVVFNVLTFLLSLSSHWDYGTELHFNIQVFISVINIGLFSGLVGWFNASAKQTEAQITLNYANNVYYQSFDPYAVVVVGVVLGVLDLVIFNSLNLKVFSGRCDAGNK